MVRRKIDLIAYGFGAAEFCYPPRASKLIGVIVFAASRSASISGEIGSRSATTKPMLCSTFGSANGTALNPDIIPRTSRINCGMMLASPIKRTFEHRLMREFVSNRGMG